ncbi:MAG: murein biosynthesis integral membrane protein MurJ [Janthinobacterium lividum]
MSFLRSVTTIGGFTALSRILGFARDILIASLLGASPLADAFFAAFKLPNFFRRLFAEGALNAAFVPLYARLYASEGVKSAQRTAEEIFAVLLVILVTLVVIFEIFMPALMDVITPGFKDTPDRMMATITFARITFPYILFISLAALIGGILNSHHRFSATSAAPIVLNVTMIVGLLLSPYCFQSPGHALAYSALLAGLLQFLWIYGAAHRMGSTIILRKPTLTPNVRRLMSAMGPGILAGGVIQINLLSDVILASFLPTGAISYLYYADRLNQLPLSIIGIALSTALLPLLSKQLQQDQLDEAQTTQNRVLEAAFLLTLPAAVALMVFATPIITVLFRRNAFGDIEVIQTAWALRAFSIGLPAYVMSKIFSTSFFARHNTRTPAKSSIVVLILNIGFTLLLMIPFKHVGIALATSITAWINAGILGCLLYKRKLFIVDDRLKHHLIRLVFSAVIMGIFLFLIQMVWPYYWPLIWQGIILLFFIAVASAVYFLINIYTGALNYQEIKLWLLRARNVRQTKKKSL